MEKGKVVHRDVLATLFWPEESDQRARKSLRNALWRVRSLIEPAGIPAGCFLTVTGRSVGLAGTGSVRLDVTEFERRVALAGGEELSEGELGDLEGCIRLYRGDFMDGHDYHWCVHERERLRLSLLLVLERLLAFHFGRGEWSLALQRGRAVLKEDPFREHVHRCLMVCHYSMGDRPLAIRQYHECAELLMNEMGIVPMESTQRLYEEIRRDSRRLIDPNVSTPVMASMRMEDRMTEALTRAEEALADLRRLTEKAQSTTEGEKPQKPLTN
jgi:DNA-binding SARP family transcriptional activator